MKKIFYIGIFLFFVNSSVYSQASLTIENNSGREMTVKVMKSLSKGSRLFERIYISAYGSQTVTFYESGYYFTKTKATKNGKDPICKKSKPFKVVDDETGYSVLTLTFTIKESSIPVSSGGQTISNQEFEKD
jgi:hypothetical protein